MTTFDFSEPDADKFTNKAFGWGNQGYWRGENVDVVPTTEQVGRQPIEPC